MLHQLLLGSPDLPAARLALLACAEQLLTGGAKAEPLLKRAPHVFKALYDADLLPEEIILEWHARPVGPGVPGAELRAAVAPFVAWLQEAEEDSDEE